MTDPTFSSFALFSTVPSFGAGGNTIKGAADATFSGVSFADLVDRARSQGDQERLKSLDARINESKVLHADAKLTLLERQLDAHQFHLDQAIPEYYQDRLERLESGSHPGLSPAETAAKIAETRAWIQQTDEKIASLEAVIGGLKERVRTFKADLETGQIAVDPATRHELLSRVNAVLNDPLPETDPASTGLATPADGTDASLSISEESSQAEAQFLELIEGGFEERYFNLFLARRGLTAESFNELPPEAQQEIIEEFRRELKEQVAQNVEKSIAAQAGLF